MAVGWTECEPGGIDRQLLVDQSIPILMYDDVVLFEDFIHDHGVVRMSVKTRIMPRCWFVLLRYWLRVDGVVMKVCDYVWEHFVCMLNCVLFFWLQCHDSGQILPQRPRPRLLAGLRHALLSQIWRIQRISRAHTAFCNVRVAATTWVVDGPISVLECRISFTCPRTYIR